VLHRRKAEQVPRQGTASSLGVSSRLEHVTRSPRESANRPLMPLSKWAACVAGCRPRRWVHLSSWGGITGLVCAPPRAGSCHGSSGCLGPRRAGYHDAYAA
jgi:hypothetical protein